MFRSCKFGVKNLNHGLLTVRPKMPHIMVTSLLDHLKHLPLVM